MTPSTGFYDDGQHGIHAPGVALPSPEEMVTYPWRQVGHLDGGGRARPGRPGNGRSGSGWDAVRRDLYDPTSVSPVPSGPSSARKNAPYWA